MLQAPSMCQPPQQAAVLSSTPLARAAPEMGTELRSSLPPPPAVEPPPPPPQNSEFEVSAFSEVAEWAGSFPQQPQYPSRPSGPSGPQATVAPGAPPPPPPVAPGVWGMGALGGSGAPGSWAPLSTSPGGGLPGGLSGGGLGGSMPSWLSTGVSECDGSAVPVNSTAMPHTAGGCSSASNSHVSYSMQPAPTSDTGVPPGLWSAASPTATSVTSSAVTPVQMPPSLMTASMPSVMQSVALPMVTPAMQIEKNGFRNQLRAEAAPYVPLNMEVGVQAC